MFNLILLNDFALILRLFYDICYVFDVVFAIRYVPLLPLLDARLMLIWVDYCSYLQCCFYFILSKSIKFIFTF